MNIALRTKAEDMTGHRKWTSHTRFGKFVLEDHRYFTVYKMIKIHHHCVLMVMKPSSDPDIQSFRRQSVVPEVSNIAIHVFYLAVYVIDRHISTPRTIPRPQQLDIYK